MSRALSRSTVPSRASGEDGPAAMPGSPDTAPMSPGAHRVSVWPASSQPGIAVRRDELASLRRECDLLNTIVETSELVVMVVDRSGAIRRANRACEEACSRSLRLLRGRPFWELLDDDGERAHARAAFRALRTRGFPGGYESWWEARDGTRRCFAFSHTALFDDEGTVEAIICAGVDVTRQKELTRAVEASDARLWALADALPSQVAFVDPSGRCLYANLALRRWAGCQDEEIAGRSLRHLLGDPIYQALRSPIEQALAGASATLEHGLPGDRPRRLRATLTPQLDPSGAVRSVMLLLDDLSPLP